MSLKVCYFGAYRANYARNQIMIAGLRAAGVEVIECHAPLWTGIEDRVNVAAGGWANLSFLKRVVSVYRKLLSKYIALDKTYEVMVLGYPGQLDVFLARLLTWLHRKPLVLDLFMSIYLIAVERELAARSKVSVNLLRRLEAFACRWPDLLICDTEAYAAWHHQTHRLAPDKFRLVPTGADDRFFKPLAGKKSHHGQFKVLYYGTYIPNHQVETIVEAAAILRDQAAIHFELVGAGPTRPTAEKLASDYGLNNILFIDWLAKEQLTEKITTADLLLGAFGTTPQSLMTIQNKIYEGLAMGKPVITGRSPVISQALPHKKYVYLVERANAQALADGVLTLYHKPALRDSLGRQGRRLFEKNYSIARLGYRFKEHLLELLG